MTADSRPGILHLVDYTELGGGETSLLALLAECRRQIPDVRLAVIVPGKGAVSEALRRLGIETHIIPYPRRLRRGPIPWFSFNAARRVAGVIDRFNPSIIHANHFFGLLYAGSAARRRVIPLVWTCHGWFDIDTRFKQWAARRWASHVSCVSESVRREAENRLQAGGSLIQPDFTSTDYLGIQPYDAPFSARDAIRCELGVEPTTPLLAVVGRFQAIKGQHYLFDALPAIRLRVPSVQVWLIGDARPGDPEEEAHKRLLVERVRAEGLGECVRFLGFRPDARCLIRAVDALVIPSERESFSMVAVEGLEAGVPVVGPDGWGPKEIIDAPRTGLLFRPGDPASLAERVIEVLCREGGGAAFDPAAGPRRVTERFTVEAHLRRTLALYQRLTGGRFLSLPGCARWRVAGLAGS